MGFPEIPIGELARSVERPERPIAGRSYRQLGVRLWGRGAYERDVIDGGETRYGHLSRVAAGDIVVNKIWARNGSVAVVPGSLQDCYVSGEFPTFQCLPDRLDPRWFHWITRARWFWDRCDSEARGTSGKNRIRPERFLAIRIPAPQLAEQRQLVARIDDIQCKSAHASLLRSSALAELEVLERAGFVVREDWPKATIDRLVDRANLKNGRSVRSVGEPSLVSCLTLSSVRRGRIDLAHVKPVPLSMAEAAPYRVHAGDVFVVRGNGSKDLVGRAGLVDREPVTPVIFPDLFIKIPLNAEAFLPEFFVAAWNARGIRRAVMDAAKTTSGIWKINQEHVAAIAVPAPSRSEQRLVVAHLTQFQAQVDAIRLLQEGTAAKLEALMPSVIDKAFRGEL